MFTVHWSALLFGFAAWFLFGFTLGGLVVFAMKIDPWVWEREKRGDANATDGD